VRVRWVRRWSSVCSAPSHRSNASGLPKPAAFSIVSPMATRAHSEPTRQYWLSPGSRIGRIERRRFHTTIDFSWLLGVLGLFSAQYSWSITAVLISASRRFNSRRCGASGTKCWPPSVTTSARNPRMRSRSTGLQLGLEPLGYTKAVRAAAWPWNQRRERRAATSTSELDRPAACLNSRPKPRTVSIQFNRLSPSRSMIGARWSAIAPRLSRNRCQFYLRREK